MTLANWLKTSVLRLCKGGLDMATLFLFEAMLIALGVVYPAVMVVWARVSGDTRPIWDILKEC